VNWLDFLLAGGAVTVGAALQGAVGFGLGLVAAPLLILVDPRLVPGPLICAAMGLTVLMAYKDRASIRLSELKWAVPGRVLGVIAAAVVLTLISGDDLRVIFGVLVLFAVGLTASKFHLDPTPRNLLIAGTLSGFMSTTVAMGGPSMALLYQRESGARIRGSLSGFFLFGIFITLIGLNVIGMFGLEEFVLALTLLPGMFLGFAVSGRIARVLDQGHTRTAALVLSAVAGLAVILT
jgi:uncharacterized membrane protein YfcA